MVERTPLDVWGEEGCRRFECEGVGRGLIEPFLVTVEVILARKKDNGNGMRRANECVGDKRISNGAALKKVGKFDVRLIHVPPSDQEKKV